MEPKNSIFEFGIKAVGCRDIGELKQPMIACRFLELILDEHIIKLFSFEEYKRVVKFFTGRVIWFKDKENVIDYLWQVRKAFVS